MKFFFARSLTHFCLLMSLAMSWIIAGTVAAENTPCDVPRATSVPTNSPPAKKIEVGVELDAYYSNINFYVPLTDENVPNFCNQSELDIYRYLLSRSLVPRFVYMELSANPLPLLGVYMRSNHRNTYDKSTVIDDFNLIESITAGFREPYAYSIFFGGLVDFVKPGASKVEGKNRAYSGYLLTAGDYQILRNQLIKDRWQELEWKIKGDRDLPNEKISWSFRVGGRIHNNQEIADSIYFGLRRSNLDFRETNTSWSKNSSITFMTEFNADNLNFQRQEVIIGKKYPLKSSAMAFSLELGGIWQCEEDIYRGSLLSESDPQNNFTFIIRPNIIF